MDRHETWVDRRIREAQERGAFDDLPGAGKPLAFLDRPQDENWWLTAYLERERVDRSLLLPPQLGLRKEAETLRTALPDEPSEQAVRERVEDYNARVRELWRRPLRGPVVVVPLLDADDLVARWQAHHRVATGTAAAAPQPAPDRAAGGRTHPRSWFGRSWLRRRR